jgi:hypothetical protein
VKRQILLKGPLLLNVRKLSIGGKRSNVEAAKNQRKISERFTGNGLKNL